MSVPLEFRSERLHLRRLTAADVPDLVELDSDPAVMRYITGAPNSRAVYEADFAGVSGPSLQSLVDARDPELAAELRREIEGALTKAQAFPATFETMIAGAEGSPERAAMEDVIDGLEDFGDHVIQQRLSSVIEAF